MEITGNKKKMQIKKKKKDQGDVTRTVVKTSFTKTKMPKTRLKFLTEIGINELIRFIDWVRDIQRKKELTKIGVSS